MAKFKVGDRVRVIAACSVRSYDLIGREGTVDSLGADSLGGNVKNGYGVTLDCPPDDMPFNDGWVFAGEHLAPLTPPAVDEWARSKVEQIKKWKPEPVIPTIRIKERH